MCLVKVTKRKTRARSSPPATESEVDADDAEDDDGLDDKDAEDDNDKEEDEDEDAELVDDDDPFFVVTITQYKFKHRLVFWKQNAGMKHIWTKRRKYMKKMAKSRSSHSKLINST